jgi:hypothetical protein
VRSVPASALGGLFAEDTLIIHMSEETLFSESVTNNLNISASPLDMISGAVKVITSSPGFTRFTLVPSSCSHKNSAIPSSGSIELEPLNVTVVSSFTV